MDNYTLRGIIMTLARLAGENQILQWNVIRIWNRMLACV